MAGHADEPRQPFFFRAHRGLEGAARPHRLLPVVGMAERVELDQIHVIHAEPLDRAMDVVARLAAAAAARLGGEKEVLPVARHPRPDAQLGVTVARRRVDVVHAVTQQDVERAVGLVLAGAREGGGAEERDAAGVAGAAERSSLDHGPLWYADRARVPQIRHRRRSPSAMTIPRFGLNRFDPRYEEAARDLGATSGQTVRHVVLPLIAPSLVGIGLFGFTLSWDEVARSSQAFGSDQNTLPLELTGLTTTITNPEIYALGTVTTGVSFLVIVVSLLLIHALRRRPARGESGGGAARR